MFLCKGCTHPAYKDYFLFAPLSKGPCENCHYTDICIDRKGVPIDPNWKENLEADLARIEGAK